MKLKALKYLVLMTATTLFSVSVFARSPIIDDYSPQVESLYPGAQILSAEFNENENRCTPRVGCQGRDFTLVVQLLDVLNNPQSLEIKYLCDEIDDGAYGNIKCIISQN